MILHEWTKQAGIYKNDQGRYTVYECEHCHVTVNYYDNLTWGESFDQAKIKVICPRRIMNTIQQPLALGRA